MMKRLFTVSETALATVRTRTFRHIHDLSMLHQQSERRGTLTSRVTSDVDQITQFLQWGGVILVVNVGQIAVTTIVMLFYSWQLALIVYATFLPLDPGACASSAGWPRVRTVRTRWASCSAPSARAWSGRR
jgi:ABC-type multidrug transport system fused ATPase/permease subunit